MPTIWIRAMRLARFCVLVPVLVYVPTRAFPQDNLPTDLQAQISDAVRALKSGDLETSERIFLDAERRGVKHPVIFHNLGIIAQQRGNHQQAVSRFRETLALQPAHGPSRLLLGASLLALGKKTEAVRELQRAVKLMPQEPRARLELAKGYEASENWIAAAQQLQKLVELAPQEPEYVYEMGKAWMKLSGWSYQQIARIEPNSPRLQQGLGQEYAIQGKYDLALAAFRRAAEANPKLPEVHLAIGIILFEQKQYDEALAEIAQELKLVPESKAAAEIKAKIEDARAGSVR